VQRPQHTRSSSLWLGIICTQLVYRTADRTLLQQLERGLERNSSA